MEKLRLLQLKWREISNDLLWPLAKNPFEKIRISKFPHILCNEAPKGVDEESIDINCARELKTPGL